MKKAILLNLINPKIGGILLSGQKGTAKSTIIRGISHIDSEKKVIELPLSITEDQLVGDVDLEKTIQTGIKQFKPGVLHRAHEQILYIDEVNLLNQHIIKMLVDSNSSGITVVEREGISASYESQFILIGSMNPEEGNVSPQILDRFGLYVHVEGEEDVNTRVEVMKRRLAFETNKETFMEQFKDESHAIQKKVEESRVRLASMNVTEKMMSDAAVIAKEANCEGHRSDLVLIETAKAMAALDGREEVKTEDFYEAAKYVLPHRQKEENSSTPQSEKNNENPSNKAEEMANDLDEQQNEQAEEESTNSEHTNSSPLNRIVNEGDSQEKDSDPNEKKPNHPIPNEQEGIAEIGEEMDIKALKDLKAFISDQKVREGSGKRSVARTETKQGRYVKATIPRGKVTDLALAPTLRAAAPYQKNRTKREGIFFTIEQQDLRQKVREKTIGNTLLFLVDASGSMGVKKRMEAVKGAILSLLQDAYQKRDEVGMIAFRNNRADVVLDITGSVDMAHKQLKELPTGGKTPLALALVKGYEKLNHVNQQGSNIIPFLILVTDGRANEAYSGKYPPLDEALIIAKEIRNENVPSLIIDTEQSRVPLGLAKKLAEHLGGMYVKLDEMKSSSIYEAVKKNI